MVLPCLIESGMCSMPSLSIIDVIGQRRANEESKCYTAKIAVPQYGLTK
ncbi:hypothetical protein [Vulcanisaeta distributa]|nr:hypothetical protein [Vulcanisaeta distributa]